MQHFQSFQFPTQQHGRGAWKEAASASASTTGQVCQIENIYDRGMVKYYNDSENKYSESQTGRVVRAHFTTDFGFGIIEVIAEVLQVLDCSRPT